jgi:hypothetical protein
MQAGLLKFMDWADIRWNPSTNLKVIVLCVASDSDQIIEITCS